jgi:hypothetical protein
MVHGDDDVAWPPDNPHGGPSGHRRQDYPDACPSAIDEAIDFATIATLVLSVTRIIPRPPAAVFRAVAITGVAATQPVSDAISYASREDRVDDPH